ncbi:NAD(P)H-hydrate dehydratase [Clostridium sp. AM58-1XD]|uniref:NAD(P)H-hydrate dehydratase n=1 Tax=Clostridium sp. AM58-1XD TaxID=2292307 RepID=UPI000E467D72|nr:NAD(P)H-hydrate dehydratase [Clostridium sp. AM58-1XD]RGZ00667.1 NAD(P)H-hydrate dehydratase [Clostridium sp. AM58-1XD]
MKYLVSSRQMKEIDRYTIEEIGIPSLVLMERAAMKVAEEAEKLSNLSDEILSVCGTGNNGADGVAAARMLKQKGYRVSVLLAGNRERGTKELRLQLDIAEKLDVPVMEFGEFLPGKCDILIDAVFGVGLGRPIEGKYKELIEVLKNLSPKKTIAVDIPSGIHGDSGAVMGCALPADVTVTFGYEKLGTALYPGRDYSGKVIVADIGFPEKSREHIGAAAFAMEKGDLAEIPRRPSYSNKGTFGKVLIVAGAKNMGGAAYLSALAAYRAGAGLVKVLTAEENRLVIQEKLPEAVVITYNTGIIMENPEERNRFSILVERECRQADAVVLGPGLSQAHYVKTVVENVLSFVCSPVILDADGLNTIAEYPELTGYYTENVIITPHLGEMARLTGKTVSEIRENLLETAVNYAGKFGITCVLKDAATVVADKEGKISVNKSGCSAMAKGGSGDVLTGMIAALIAQGMEESAAARMGVYLHGLCGERAAAKAGAYGVLAHEIADEAGNVLKKLG